MSVKKRCSVGRVVAELWLLGWVAFASGVDLKNPLGESLDTSNLTTIVKNITDETSTLSSVLNENVTKAEDNVPGVVSLEMEAAAKKATMKLSNMTINNENNDSIKSEILNKDFDIKMTTEAKKKPVTEFKTKLDTKYQKLKEDDKSIDSTKLNLMESTTPMTISKNPKTTIELNVPLLIHGEPIEVKENLTNNETEEIDESTMISRGRALNISSSEPTNSLHANLTDLSDVSMDDEDKEVEGGEYVAMRNETMMVPTSTQSSVALVSSIPTITWRCYDRNKTYAIGEKIIRGCDEKCVCSTYGTIIDCKPLCEKPTFRAGRNKDPYCREETIGDDGCCALLTCADSAPEPEESCVFGNKTLSRGQRVEDGCSKVCVCEAAGALKCQPRCPPNDNASRVNQHDRCVALPDPRDTCCTITLCDVTIGDHDIKTENSGDLSVNLTNVKVLNSTSIKLKMSAELKGDVVVEISENNHVWRQQKPDKNGIITNLEPARSYYVRIIEGGRTGPALQIFLPAEVIKTNITEKVDKASCSHRGKLYKIGAEWYDECISFCVCSEGAKTECVTIECPTDFGLDVLDPHCLDWETVPANFVPKAPQCCPSEVRCRNNGSCFYNGENYDNWSELPLNVTGCEKRCYCEMGNVSCQAACPPVTALPPPTLQCPSNQAILAHLPGDDCCMQWVCDHSATHPVAGMDVTPAYPGPLFADHNISVNTERVNNESVVVENSNLDLPNVTSAIPNHYNSEKVPNNGLLHYPMDPGHPTIPYNGPYNPDYKPTQPTLEQVFRLPTYTEKSATIPKDKSKSKADAKKPLEPVKAHKEIQTDQRYNYEDGNDQQLSSHSFPGPLAPNRFPLNKLPSQPTRTKTLENPHISSDPMNPNKLPPLGKGHTSEQPQFIPLKPPPNIPNNPYAFVPSNGENIPPTSFVNEYTNSDAGPPYGGLGLHPRPDFHDPNFVVAPISKKKPTTIDTYVDDVKSKPGQYSNGKIKTGQRIPFEQGILPDELLRLINQQHPGLTHLEHAPPQGHSGLYDIHRQIAIQKDPQGYFSQLTAVSGNNNNNNNNNNNDKSNQRPPHIVSQKNENGQTTYHVHTSEIPNSPQQIEELLAHISEHDSNLGPFQHYPGQSPISHNFADVAGSPPPIPPGIDIRLPGSSGSPHLNHPFAAQASPNQSGLDHHNVPAGFPIVGGLPGYSNVVQGHQGSQDEVAVKALEALDDTTIRIVFMVPPIFVGLQARVEMRYTSDKTNHDPSTWKSQVFIPPNDLIATPQLEFELDGLEPSTDYQVRVTVNLRGLANSPSSKIYIVRTLDRNEELPTLPPQIPMDAELRLVETNSTWINVMWKKFTEYEMQFIDGVQLRYKEHDSKVYAATPLIHRAVTSYVIENLKPSTTYEIGISIIPFPGQTTELISDKTIQVVTSIEPDPYAFDVKVDIKTIKSTAVEVSWSGVPYPEDKYVNIYRAILQSDSGKEDTSTFKIAKRDSPAKTLVSDLKPGTRYRLWIEVYLTNGRTKKSNVQDFVTKPGIVLPAGVSQQGKLASIPLHEGDYYGPLIIVAIVASLAILSTLILLMMFMKRRSSSKADISPRKTTAAYDNPSYKTCEDAGPIANGQNKNTEHEMATINVSADIKETA